MCAKKKNLSSVEGLPVPDASNMCFGILTSAWNSQITEALQQGAVNTLKAHGVKDADIIIHKVPGSYELPQAAAYMIRELPVDAVICLGCLIQGETRHFEFISQAVANACMTIGLETYRPVIFGVLTTDTFEQAAQRSGGKHGNKGDEAAVAAIQMIHLKRKMKSDSQEFRDTVQ